MDARPRAREQLIAYAMDRLSAVPEALRSTARRTPTSAGGVVAFTLGDIHPHDIATLLDQKGIAIRAGHHCCQPLMDRYDVPALGRASFYVYSNEEDVERLVAGLGFVREVFGG